MKPLQLPTKLLRCQWREQTAGSPLQQLRHRGHVSSRCIRRRRRAATALGKPVDQAMDRVVRRLSKMLEPREELRVREDVSSRNAAKGFDFSEDVCEGHIGGTEVEYPRDRLSLRTV